MWDLVSREALVQDAFKKIGFTKIAIPEAPAVKGKN